MPNQRFTSSPSFTYDVFLSFCGSDIGHGFAGNLLKALHDRGIHTFIEDEELHRGDEVIPAIKESRIAMIIFSKNYVASSLCYILDSFHPIHQCIFPLFYDVDPSYILARHEEEMILKDDNKEDKLQKWRNALRHVASLRFKHRPVGYDEFEFSEMIVGEIHNRAPPLLVADEAELVGRTVEEVSTLAPLHVADYLGRVAYDEFKSNGRIVDEVSNCSPLPIADNTVGLEFRLEEVSSLLELGSDEVLMVGIYGMEAIGKTTLARAVYNKIVDQFEGSCFLDNVRAISKIHGLVHLQNILLSQITGEKDIQQMLCQKKVLLILDDVDKLDQLEALVGGLDWFASGSRVIITTRDRHLLAFHGVERRYEVQPLNHSDALQLLSSRAFVNQGNVDPSYTEILNQAVTYASGRPLALKVIGHYLGGKRVDEWRDALHRFKRFPRYDIQTIRKISFDSLEGDEKSIFLDIIHYFTGYKLAEVHSILCSHYCYNVGYHIQVLIDKSLISTSSDGKVILHPFIEDMGKKILHRESLRKPGKRSWFLEDVFQILTRKKITGETELMLLEEIEWDGEAFMKIENFRTQNIMTYLFSKTLKNRPDSLRGVEWWRYLSWLLPSDFDPKQFDICKLPKINFMQPEPAELLKTSLSVVEVSQTSQSVPEVLHTYMRVAQDMLQSSHRVSEVSQSVHVVLQTSTWGARVMLLIQQRDFQAETMWRLVGLVSSLVGLSCHALSPSFKHLIRGWNPFKFFLYGVFSLVICSTILFAKHYLLSPFYARLKTYMCFAFLMIISSYSYWYDKAVNGKPEIRSLVANAAFALVSLSLSKLFKFGFEMGVFSYFLTCFTVQLLTINWKLVLVAIILGCPLFVMHSSSESRPVVGNGGPYVAIDIREARS